MEPVLLVQTRVPAGDGGESKQGQGRVGGERVRETWKGKCQLGFTLLVASHVFIPMCFL